MDNQPYNNDNNYVSSVDAPMSMKDWFITMLLMMIPFVNIILMFVWAFSSNTNTSKKNFFRVQLIFMAIIVIFYIIAGAAIIGSLSQF